MDLSTILQLVTTAAVVVGVAFGLLEVRQLLRARRDYAAVEVVRSVQAQEVQDAVDRILRLPKDADPEVIRSDPALSQAANLVYYAAEMFGSIVYEGVVELHTLDRMVGADRLSEAGRARATARDKLPPLGRRAGNPVKRIPLPRRGSRLTLGAGVPARPHG